MTLGNIRRLTRLSKIRLGVAIALVALCTLVAVHHEMPMDMHDSAAALMCLGIVVVVGLSEARRYRLEVSLPAPLASCPTSARARVHEVGSQLARAGPLADRSPILRH